MHECKTNLVNWKEKAKKYRSERDALQKRIQEVKASRSGWKSKYQSLKSRQKSNSPTASLGLSLSATKVANHSYCLEVISLILLLRRANCSLACCVEVIRLLVDHFGLKSKIPCRSSILNWEKKLGYTRLDSLAHKDQEWAIILDESISIGKQKLLVILGLELSDYKFGQALSLSEVKVLSLRLSDSWKSEEIQEELVQLTQTGYCIRYAVSDGGKNICKALRVSNIIRISDCTHAIGKLLERQYKKDELFNTFLKECSAFKRKNMLGNASFIIPPSIRAKGRFLNLQPLSKWACQVLKMMEHPPSEFTVEIKEKLEWLIPYKQMLIDIDRQCQTMMALFKVLKNQGLSAESLQECENLLEQYPSNEYFEDGVKNYLQEQFSKLESDSVRLCCSDIIESLFGKYKYQLKRSASGIITDSCLTIANLTNRPEKEEIRLALQKTKVVDLQKWKQENIPDSLMSKRKRLFKNVG